MVWPDVAKGLCIILVVLHHLVSKHYASVLPGSMASVGEAWEAVTYGLKPLRMPLFFLISGFFASRALRRPWGDEAATRVAGPYYLYALWLCIHAVAFSFAADLAMNRTGSVTELLVDLTFASTGLWYLYALAVYFALAKALRRVDARAVLTLAAILAVAAPLLPLEAYNRVSVLQHFVFFAAGAYLPTAVHRIAASEHRHAVAKLTLAYATTTAVLSWLELGRGPTTVLLSLAAVPLGVKVAVALSARPRVAQVASFIGRRTLPIYVLHMPVLAVLHHMAGSTSVASLGSVQWGLLIMYPLAATAGVTIACLLTHRLMIGAGGSWLFSRPTTARLGVHPLRRRLRGTGTPTNPPPRHQASSHD